MPLVYPKDRAKKAPKPSEEGAELKFRTVDGHVVAGNSYEDVVEGLASRKFTTVRSLSSYRESVARRARQFGNRLDPSSDEALITSAENAGLLKRIG